MEETTSRRVVGYADGLASAAGVVAAVGAYSEFSLEKRIKRATTGVFLPLTAR